MAKLVLTDITSLANSGSAISTINNNFTAMEAALENTLSRNGQAPNAMAANLDMGNNRLINLADPLSDGDGVNRRSVAALVDQKAGQIAQAIIEGSGKMDIFTATAAQTMFQLTNNPKSQFNTLVFDNGIMMVPGVDYALSGDTITFSTGRTNGNKIAVWYTLLAPHVASVNTVIEPTLENGFQHDVSGFYQRIGYWKDDHGIVHLRGMVQGGAPAARIFTLPLGYRPLRNQHFALAGFGQNAQSGDVCRLNVWSDGQVLAGTCSTEGTDTFDLGGAYWKTP